MAKTGSVFDQLEQLGGGTSFTAQIGDMLEQVEMFRDLSRQDIDRLSSYVQAYQAKPGAKLLREGDREAYMFILVEGKLDVFKQQGDGGEEKKIATVRAGKTIGEMSVIDGMPHSATVVVVEPAKLLLITKRNLDLLTEQAPDLGVKLLRRLAQLMSLRLRQTSGVLIDYLKS